MTHAVIPTMIKEWLLPIALLMMPGYTIAIALQYKLCHLAIIL